MTSLRRRVENVLVELAIIKEAMNNSKRCPPCCIKVQVDGKISCDAIGPLPEKDFLKECNKCQEWIRRILCKINVDSIKAST